MADLWLVLQLTTAYRNLDISAQSCTLLFRPTLELWALLMMPDMAVQVTLKGSGTVLTASAQDKLEATVAKQQAALDLVHQLQHAVLNMLTASQPDKTPVTAMQNSSGNEASPAMKTLHEGDVENSMPEIGNVVKIQYQLVRESQTSPSKGDNTTTAEAVGETKQPLFPFQCMLMSV